MIDKAIKKSPPEPCFYRMNEFIMKHDLSQFGGFMDTNFDKLLGSLYEELGEHD